MMELIEWIDSEIVYHAKEVNPLDNEFNKIHSSMIVALKDVKAKATELRDTVERDSIIESHVECVRQGTERENDTIFTKEDEAIVRRDITDYYTQTYQSK